MVGLLVSRTTFSGHLRSDLIRMAALSMISGRSGKLAGGTGKNQPAINRRTASAPPTTTKYLAMGTADGPGDFSNPGRRMAAMLDHTLVAQQIDQGCHTAASRVHCPPHSNPALTVPGTTCTNCTPGACIEMPGLEADCADSEQQYKVFA
jgi:hypothetical protein